MTKSGYAYKFTCFIYRKNGFLKSLTRPDSNGHVGCEIELHFDNINMMEMKNYIEEFHSRIESTSFYIRMVSIQNNVVILTSSYQLYREVEEAQAEEAQAEEVQAEEVQAKEVKAGPKRLKPATIKNYSAKQLAKHLDRLQDHFVDAPYRIDFAYSEVSKYNKEDNCYYFECDLICKYFILRAVNDSYRLLGI